MQIDLLDEASIAAAAATILDKHGRLDILVNNACIVDLTQQRGKPPALPGDSPRFDLYDGRRESEISTKR